jgi:hypothetical protein
MKLEGYKKNVEIIGKWIAFWDKTAVGLFVPRILQTKESTSVVSHLQKLSVLNLYKGVKYLFLNHESKSSNTSQQKA